MTDLFLVVLLVIGVVLGLLSEFNQTSSQEKEKRLREMGLKPKRDDLCDYCGTQRRGMRCANCGAPQPDPRATATSLVTLK
jgi:hypothetical protein